MSCSPLSEILETGLRLRPSAPLPKGGKVDSSVGAWSCATVSIQELIHNIA